MHPYEALFHLQAGDGVRGQLKSCGNLLKAVVLVRPLKHYIRNLLNIGCLIILKMSPWHV